MPFTFTPEMALGIFQAAMAIKAELSAGRSDAEFTDADALALLKTRTQEGLDIVAEWRSRPTTPG